VGECEAFSHRKAAAVSLKGFFEIAERHVSIPKLNPRWVPEFKHPFCCDVHGIVERFGRYVLGTEGWRAEWCVIRELMAPDAKTALALMKRYPKVKVHVRKQEAV
jgi:hypothetical protein